MQAKVYNPKYKVEIATSDGLKDVSGNVFKIEVNTTARDMVNKFRLTFVPRTDANKEDIYDYIEPMAFVRIKFTHTESAEDMPTVIRGFVTNVSKNMAIHDGRPMRTIVVTGENYGKLIKMTYIHYLLGLDPEKVFSASGTQYPFLTAYAIDLVNGDTKPSDWLNALFETFIQKSFNLVKQYMLNRRAIQGQSDNPKQENTNKLSKDMDDFVLDIDKDGVDGIRAPVGISDNKAYTLVLTDPGAAAADTSLYDFVVNYNGSPWNEIYTDDAPDMCYLIYRPFPFRDREEKWVGYTAFAKPDSYSAPSGRKDWNEFKEIDPDEVVAYSLQRTDEEVYNYFFTDANCSIPGANYEIYSRSKLNNKNPHYTVDVKNTGGSGATQLTPSDKLNYSRMELYGFRKYQRTTNWLSLTPGDVKDPDSLKRVSDAETSQDPSMIAVGEQLSEILFNGMEHNSQLEQGEIVIKGREDIRPGMFIDFKDDRADTEAHSYYVQEVFHSFVPYDSFVTRLIVSRGEAHLDHITDEKNRY